MSPEQSRLLLERYPLLFKRNVGSLAVGDGWFDLLDVLCTLLTADHERARERYDYLRSVEGSVVAGETVDAIVVERARLAMAEAAQQVPTVEQVKEKYGTLRFYVGSASQQAFDHIEFAELMSGRICEVCGKPGKQRHGGWIRTLCDEHAKARA